jgi:DNA-binding NarL/FixJ family response regulator
MGAEPWAERARRELAAAGELREVAAGPVERLLSPQELQIALFAREGATNRVIAARLFISPKTVEYHLGNAFQKLGVRSRVELVNRLAAG